MGNLAFLAVLNPKKKKCNILPDIKKSCYHFLWPFFKYAFIVL